MKDIRPPDIRNETAAALLARRPDGKAVAVVVNFASHPEGMGSKNRSVSSDYPHYLREAVERSYPGAVAVFISADLGGMQTPDLKEHTWAEIQRCGETIAARACQALGAAAEVRVPGVDFVSAPVDFPLENRRFIAAFQAGTFGKDLGDTVRDTEAGSRFGPRLSALRLGEILFVSVPGEAFPEVGQEVFARMDARHKFLVGLGQDEIGYILPKADFDPKKYEESMSLGPADGPHVAGCVEQTSQRVLMAKYDYRGVIHCHSTYSDGTGDMEEIAKAANDAGLDFVLMTDHDQMKPVEDGQEKWAGSSLIICGTEITPDKNHYIVFGDKKLKDVDKLRA